MTMEKFSSAQKCVNDHISLYGVEKQKTPPERGSFQRCAVGSRRAHCVMSTRKVYALREEHAISARILMILSMA
ncbi:hypothetical protein FDW96_14680 [Citrobacter sp. TBCS-15]|nr:hypothetical protein FDW89_17095 [Citrobacter sp. wls830]TKU00614.1 hypothetical protein FDW96_14680 [Citrobacter sp. TBCS-15]TKU52135.1 hypothetical protein FDX11_02705 [Citrobacter sp. wls714]TKU71583.1 hypothetical protein FDW92_20495 [Citrobacter sp. wls706]TKU76535.1 hypothetical protein FDX14_05690 [Citrobacter sp. wls710]